VRGRSQCEEGGEGGGDRGRLLVLGRRKRDVSAPVKRGVAGLDIPTYCRLAEQGMMNFFKKSGMWDSYISLRQQVEKYEYTK
jgi:hypothetical protein